jgi:hypothetical protein
MVLEGGSSHHDTATFELRSTGSTSGKLHPNVRRVMVNAGSPPGSQRLKYLPSMAGLDRIVIVNP